VFHLTATKAEFAGPGVGTGNAHDPGGKAAVLKLAMASHGGRTGDRKGPAISGTVIRPLWLLEADERFSVAMLLERCEAGDGRSACLPEARAGLSSSPGFLSPIVAAARQRPPHPLSVRLVGR